MVATPSRAVARWASHPIDVGNGTVFRQHIIGPETIPKVIDAAQAAREPELAVLSAITHARRNTPAARRIARAVITGLEQVVDAGQRMLYSLALQNAMSAALRKVLAMDPDIRNFLDASQRRAYDSAEARGEARGRAQGEAKGKAEAVRKILTKRGLPIMPHQHRQIHECTDLATLDRWLDQALTAASVDELFAKTRRNGRQAARRNGHRAARRA
jgi:predicted transposase YdaD